MKLIKKLGMYTAYIGSTKKEHYGLYECKNCKSQWKRIIRTVKTNQPLCNSCYAKVYNKTHGDTNTFLWKRWKAMRSRCIHDLRYTQLGITVCKEWQQYLSFKIWAISKGYTEQDTLDRIDGTKGYYPKNCRWTDKTTQACNKLKPKDNTSG